MKHTLGTNKGTIQCNVHLGKYQCAQFNSLCALINVLVSEHTSDPFGNQHVLSPRIVYYRKRSAFAT